MSIPFLAGGAEDSSLLFPQSLFRVHITTYILTERMICPLDAMDKTMRAKCSIVLDYHYEYSGLDYRLRYYDRPRQ